ncbi:hypothetical protein CcrC1_gp424 [Caulobacter phage C1]|nr:hypothetical protein CcrC1_gp424 [Caulobacter phage C1]UTU08653.1 hypothetical protein CcrC2_gp425 [Caulobacter phage C2]UTU09166.1 hypothetical protein CcrJ4_gp419 [Caulobacter phage J4]UTU10285.1 hypothetical protein CcrRB23_gp423 [Caulobacter phage RB23]WGN97319.1 hypothetical protein [Bertelyvirus sp.]
MTELVFDNQHPTDEFFFATAVDEGIGKWQVSDDMFYGYEVGFQRLPEDKEKAEADYAAYYEAHVKGNDKRPKAVTAHWFELASWVRSQSFLRANADFTFELIDFLRSLDLEGDCAETLSTRMKAQKPSIWPGAPEGWAQFTQEFKYTAPGKRHLSVILNDGLIRVYYTEPFKHQRQIMRLQTESDAFRTHFHPRMNVRLAACRFIVKMIIPAMDNGHVFSKPKL